MLLAQRITVIRTTALIPNHWQLSNHNIAGGTLVTLSLEMLMTSDSRERTLLYFFPRTRALNLNLTSTLLNPRVVSRMRRLYWRVHLLTYLIPLMKKMRMNSSSKMIRFSVPEKQSFKIFLKVIPRMKTTPHYPLLYLNIPLYEMHMSMFLWMLPTMEPRTKV